MNGHPADPNLILAKAVSMADLMNQIPPDGTLTINHDGNDHTFPALTQDRVPWQNMDILIPFVSSELKEQEGELFPWCLAKWMGLALGKAGINNFDDFTGLNIEVFTRDFFDDAGFDHFMNVPNWINQNRVRQVLRRAYNFANYGNTGGHQNVQHNHPPNDPPANEGLQMMRELLEAQKNNNNDPMNFLLMQQALGGGGSQKSIDMADVAEMLTARRGGERLNISELYANAALGELPEEFMVPRKMIQLLRLAAQNAGTDDRMAISPFPFIDIANKKFINLGTDPGEMRPTNKEWNEAKWIRGIFSWLQAALVSESVTILDVFNYMNVILKVSGDCGGKVAWEYHTRKMRSLERKSEIAGDLTKVQESMCKIDNDLLSEIKIEGKWEAKVGLASTSTKYESGQNRNTQGTTKRAGTNDSPASDVSSGKAKKALDYKEWARGKPCKHYNEGSCKRGADECFFDHECIDCDTLGCWSGKKNCQIRR